VERTGSKLPNALTILLGARTLAAMRVFLRGACLLAFGVLTLRAAGPRASSSDWTRKIDPRIIAEGARDPAAESDCLIILNEQADLSEAALLPTKLEKGQFVFERLIEVAARSRRRSPCNIGLRLRITRSHRSGQLLRTTWRERAA